MNNNLSPEQLQALVEKLSWNDAFGCYTRAGFEKLVWPLIADSARWIVYFDVDGMHDLNEKFGGYDQVDAMIRDALGAVRNSDYVAGQYKSGDEFLVCLTENAGRTPLDPEGLQERLIVALAKHGLSATFAIAPVKSKDLRANVQPAIEQVYAAKKMRGGRRS